MTLFWGGKLRRKEERVQYLMIGSWGESVQGEYPCAFCVTDKSKNPGITTNNL